MIKRRKNDRLLYDIVEEARQVLSDISRWRSLFDEANSDELVELCVAEIRVLEKKYRFLSGCAAGAPAARKKKRIA